MVGIVGVVIAAALVAVVATRTGQGDASPKRTYALVFGIIGVYVENPATMPEPELWAAMAIAPIDAEAARARKQIWSTTRSSMQTGMLVTLLIFLTVPTMYLTGSFVPLLIGAPLIVLIALAKGLPLLAGRGLDRAYDNVSRAMAPLGLAVTEQPELTIEPRYVDPIQFGPATAASRLSMARAQGLRNGGLADGPLAGRAAGGRARGLIP